MTAGALGTLLFLIATRGKRLSTDARRIAWKPFAVAGAFFGLSYVCLFAAFYRARVTVVSPLVATESLWGVTLSALLFKRTEVVGARLAGAAVLVVAGGTLISVFR
jgi:drug/metabolite transporter (DMT)-like permease